MAIPTIESSECVLLPQISYEHLLHDDPDEITKLFDATTNLGFFYLDLDNYLDPSTLFTLAEKVFGLSRETKMKYEMDGKNGVYFGYKPIGSMYFDKNGTPDDIEFWNISKDEILIQNKIDYPPPILHEKGTISNYMIKCHEIVSLILRCLSKKLNIDPNILNDLHRLHEPSGDQLRMTKTTFSPMKPPNVTNVALGPHTDFGSITILFNYFWGLQVLMPNSKWEYVKPLPGCAIVNIGDSLVLLTNGILKSNIHRVVSIQNISEAIDRYSVVYFSRPENKVQMKSILNESNVEDTNATLVLTAQEWIAKRVKNLQTVNFKDENTYKMSRGTEGDREESKERIIEN